MTIRTADHTRITPASHWVLCAHWYQVVHGTSSGLLPTAKPMTSAMTMTLPAISATARMKASGRFSTRMASP